MARPLDPYRTLELPRDATLDDVKAAYRRLAKLYHPDSAGERALSRFLAVQAAYESLTEGPGKLRSALGARAGRASRPGADPWAGRPPGARPRATRGTTGPAGPSGARSGTRTGPRGAPAGPSAAGAGAGPSPGEGAGGGRPGSSRTRGPAGPRPRRTRRAPGSTSYDGAESEPFEPEWQGASWYGGSSGTYWTLNPREFADPRKHGPEYLARGADSRGGTSRPRRPRNSEGRNAGAAGADGAAAAASGDGPAAGRPAGPGRGDHDTWAAPPDLPRDPGGARAEWPAARSSRSDVSAFGLVGAALLAVALLAVLFAIMAEPAAPGSTSVVPVVAFGGIAIVVVVRVLLRDGRPRA